MTCEQCYEYFKQRVEYYIKEYKVTEWDYKFNRQKLPHSKAGVRYHHNGTAEFLFSDTYEYTDDAEINETAKHEVVHLLLGGYTLLAEKRFIPKAELDLQLEVCVDRLVGLL